MSQYSFWLERLFVNKQLSIHVYDEKGKLLECIGINESDEDPFVSDLQLYGVIKERYQVKRKPLILMEDGWAAYSVFEDKEGNLYIGGPANIASKAEEKAECTVTEKNMI